MTIMKDSGIEWIGQIPKNWIEVPFKAYFTTGKGLSFTKADLTPQGHAVVSYGQVHSKANTGTRLDDSLLRYVPDSITENGESSRMNKGDFIFADTSEDLEGCGNCVYVDRDIELYAGYHSVTAKPKVQYNNKFFAYYFQAPCWRNQIRSRVTGIKVFSISQSIINKTWLFVPPLLTQQKIANYLDKVCGDIDDMVTLQEQMIEELKAYKQSVITEAVTKGVNPEVPMQHSDIEWIGEIPKHWRIIKMRRCVKTIGDVDHYMPKSVEKGIPYIKGSEIFMANPFRRCEHLSKSRTPFVDEMLLKEGQILVTCAGSCGNIKLITKEYEEKEAIGSQDIIRIDSNYRDEDYLFNKEYLFTYLQLPFVYSYFQSLKYGSVIERIEPFHVESIPIIEPSIELSNGIKVLIRKYMDSQYKAFVSEEKAIRMVEEEIEKWNN